MNNYFPDFGEPPRKLTAELRAYAKKRSKLNFFTSITIVIVLILSGSFAVILDIMLLADVLFNCFDNPTPTGFRISVLICNSLTLFSLLYLLIRKRKHFKQYCSVLMNGDITNAYISEIGTDWHMQIDNTPRTYVDMVVEDKSFRIKTFVPEILNYCVKGSDMPIIWHRDMPQIIIPIESLNPPPKGPEPETFVV